MGGAYPLRLKIHLPQQVMGARVVAEAEVGILLLCLQECHVPCTFQLTKYRMVSVCESQQSTKFSFDLSSILIPTYFAVNLH